MKRTFVCLAAISVILLASMSIAPISFAQPAGAAPGGWTIGIPSIPDIGEYSSATVAIDSVMGKITKIEPMKGVKNGLQMRLKSAKGEYIVWMGPKWFIENQKITFKAGDAVEVRGRIYNASTFVATEISKADWTMKIRNEEDGLPNWECCFPRKASKEE